MKNQAFFSSKDKRTKLKCSLLQFLFGALRVKATEMKIFEFASSIDPDQAAALSDSGLYCLSSGFCK